MPEISKILFITLSNIGDAILSLPALDSLKENFPAAEISVITGPRPQELFEHDARIHRVIVYDKHSGIKKKLSLFRDLKEERFDLVVDLRNSLLGALLPARYKISPFFAVPGFIRHMKDRHLYLAQSVIRKARKQLSRSQERRSLHCGPEDEEYIRGLLQENRIGADERLIAVSAGARSHTKRWPKERFARLIARIAGELNAKIILVGDKLDAGISRQIVEASGLPLADLTGKTGLIQLACLLKKAALVITNDSAVSHLASYLNVPLVTLFGPTNEIKYGPWSDKAQAIRKEVFCRPCEKAQCRFGTLECLSLIKVEDVLRQIRIVCGFSAKAEKPRQDFQRILVVRTDRIGDVLLSTPVISALRAAYPFAYIAMMVRPYAKDILEGNPDLDQIILYDRDGKHKSWQRSFKFARNLKKKRFDVAIVLHPTNRAHIVTFFAGIKKRIGYDRKLGFLLTDRIRHTKHLGEKHELEYSLDLVRYLGILPEEKNIFMPLSPASEEWVRELFAKEGLSANDKLLAIHPGASCPSKIWPNERFAQVADKLAGKYGFKVLIVAGPKDISLAQNIVKHMHSPAINLAGKTSVSQLASILKRCRLFISNDSGPVHVASAVGTPVISIFGRSQKGLSPLRWGPTGKHDRVAQGTVGCVECLAHNCVRGFVCLKAVTVDYVLNIADSILQG